MVTVLVRIPGPQGIDFNVVVHGILKGYFKGLANLNIDIKNK